MKTLLVGDLHGQHELVELALEQGMPVIFMGDYMDSFTRSTDDQLITIRAVLQAVEDGKAQALLGNHELSYLEPGMRCSGWKSITEYQMRHIDVSHLKDFIWAEGFLLSHAGVSQKLLDSEGTSLDVYLNGGEYMQIGSSRGGRNAVGGLFWCDWNWEFEPIPGYRPRLRFDLQAFRLLSSESHTCSGHFAES